MEFLISFIHGLAGFAGINPSTIYLILNTVFLQDYPMVNGYRFLLSDYQLPPTVTT
ncbi:hypothetical protein [Paenibacillus sp. Marseille-Q9583]